jgi:hypothetical protein
VTTDASPITASAVFLIKGGFMVSPIYIYRSALPVNLIDGRDLTSTARSTTFRRGRSWPRATTQTPTA